MGANPADFLEKSFSNMSLKTMADLIGIETTNKRKAVTPKSTYKHTFFTSTDIHLLVMLHFAANSQTGITHTLRTDDVASVLSVHKKTVIASFARLEAASMIRFPREDALPSSGLICCEIVDYVDMYKRRGEGGRGYITMSMELLNRILAMKSVNELRLAFRILAATITEELSGTTKTPTAILSFEELKNGLPSYLKPGVFKHCLGSVGDLFESVIDSGKRIAVTLSEKFQAGAIKEKVRCLSDAEIGKTIQSVNDAVDHANMELLMTPLHSSISKESETQFQQIGVQFPSWRFIRRDVEFKKIPKLELSEQERVDCSLLAQDYGVSAVIKTVLQYFQIYKLGGIELPVHPNGLGGLFRTMLREDKTTLVFA